MNIYGLKAHYPEVTLPLAGWHQQVNAACAVAAAEVLAEREPALGPRAIRDGLAATAWPGRFEVFAGQPAVVLDAAHNPAAAAALRDTLVAHFPERRIVLVFGILTDKDWAGVTAALAPVVDAVVVTRPPANRAGDWERVAVEVRKYCAEVYTEAGNRVAVDHARNLAGAEGVVVITGSIYLIGAVRPHLVQSLRLEKP